MKLKELKSLVDIVEREHGDDIEAFIFDFYHGQQTLDGFEIKQADTNIYDLDNKLVVEKGRKYLILG